MLKRFFLHNLKTSKMLGAIEELLYFLDSIELIMAFFYTMFSRPFNLLISYILSSSTL